MRDTREIQTEPVRGGKKIESEAGVELRRNQFQPVPVAELAGVLGGRSDGYLDGADLSNLVSGWARLF